MEDNVIYAKGRLAKSNAEFVARAARLIREANKDVAKPAQARSILGLKSAEATRGPGACRERT